MIGGKRLARRQAKKPSLPVYRDQDPARSRLTGRERQVLELIARGLTNKEVGSQLGIAVATVNQHLRNLFLKSGSCNRTQLAVNAIRLGIIPNSRKL